MYAGLNGDIDPKSMSQNQKFFVCKFVTADLKGEEMRFVKGRGGRGQGSAGGE